MSTAANDRRATFMEVRRLELFHGLNDDDVAGLVQLAERVSLLPGQLLFEQGDLDSDFFAVLLGRLEVARPTPVGAQVTARLERGQVVGEVAFCDGLPHAATVTAETASELVRFPAAVVRELIASDVRFGVALLRMLAHSLNWKIRQAGSFMSQIVAPAGTPPAPVPAGTGDRVGLGPDAKLAALRELGLTGREVDVLAGTMRAETYPPGAFIAIEGDIGNFLYLLVDGHVRVSRRFAPAGEEALAVLGRGELFGEPSLIGAQPVSADLRSDSSGCTVLSINRRRLEALLRDRPRLGAELLALYCRILCCRIRSLTESLVAWRVMAGNW